MCSFLFKQHIAGFEKDRGKDEISYIFLKGVNYKLRMMVALNKDELNALQFPVMVEMWRRMNDSMSRRKKYNETFTEKERTTIGRYHAVFRNWYLVSGTPEEATMSIGTLTLLKKALDFFASL